MQPSFIWSRVLTWWPLSLSPTFNLHLILWETSEFSWEMFDCVHHLLPCADWRRVGRLQRTFGAFTPKQPSAEAGNGTNRVNQGSTHAAGLLNNELAVPIKLHIAESQVIIPSTLELYKFNAVSFLAFRVLFCVNMQTIMTMVENMSSLQKDHGEGPVSYSPWLTLGLSRAVTVLFLHALNVTAKRVYGLNPDECRPHTLSKCAEKRPEFHSQQVRSY